MKSQLDVEFQTFQNKKAELAKEHEGEFVLIKGSEIIDIFEKELDAVDAGVKMFGKDCFMVNEITTKPFVMRSFPSFIRV